MSTTRVDLPEPLTPVTTFKTPRPNSASTFLRLFSPASNHNHPAGFAASGNGAKSLRSGEHSSGCRGCFHGGETRGRSLIYHLPSLFTGARSHIDDVIGAAHNRLVVFDHHDRVSIGSQAFQNIHEPLVIPGMKPDRGLVQNI